MFVLVGGARRFVSTRVETPEAIDIAHAAYRKAHRQELHTSVMTIARKI